MVDLVEFEHSLIIDKFIHAWRFSGNQRLGFLLGKYVPTSQVPLGIKALVQTIYEPPQENGSDFIQLLDSDNSSALELAAKLGMCLVGVIFTDLLDDGSQSGKVICKRHIDSYFMTCIECIFASQMQLMYPANTAKGKFSSRFVTCIVSGALH
jgi:nuclear protein localization family protein 4